MTEYKKAHKMSNEELTDLYIQPGLQLFCHPESEEVLKEMKQRGIMDRAKVIAESRSRGHVATYGTYRT